MSRRVAQRVQFADEHDAEWILVSDGSWQVTLPFTTQPIGRRQLVTLADGSVQKEQPWATDPTALQTALRRGYQWRDQLLAGDVDSLREIATREQVNNSYVSRMINLTLLAPDIQQAIIDDTLPTHISLIELSVNPPRLWEDQR